MLLALALTACGSEDPTIATPTATTETGATSSTTPASTTARTCKATPEQTEGPYYTANPPRRRAIAGPGTSGRRLVIRGRVLSTKCKPIARARVDFWQADGKGAYDNSGYRLRGYQLADAGGRYRVATVVPGLYEGRTRHIHVKVTPPGGATLTTQLYFPGESANKTDSIFTSATLLRLKRVSGPWKGTFDFAVPG